MMACSECGCTSIVYDSPHGDGACTACGVVIERTSSCHQDDSWTSLANEVSGSANADTTRSMVVTCLVSVFVERQAALSSGGGGGGGGGVSREGLAMALASVHSGGSRPHGSWSRRDRGTLQEDGQTSWPSSMMGASPTKSTAAASSSSSSSTRLGLAKHLAPLEECLAALRGLPQSITPQPSGCGSPSTMAARSGGGRVSSTTSSGRSGLLSRSSSLDELSGRVGGGGGGGGGGGSRSGNSFRPLSPEAGRRTTTETTDSDCDDSEDSGLSFSLHPSPATASGVVEPIPFTRLYSLLEEAMYVSLLVYLASTRVVP